MQLKYEPNWLQNLQETAEELLQDVVLLEAMDLRMEQPLPRMTNVSREILTQTHQRIMDYLSQHAADLYRLSQIKNAQELP